MPNFEPTGDLYTDLQLAIENSNVVNIDYVDRKGNYSNRNIAPLEIRGDRIYSWSLDKNDLRLFILASIGGYTVLDDVFNKEDFS